MSDRKPNPYFISPKGHIEIVLRGRDGKERDRVLIDSDRKDILAYTWVLAGNGYALNSTYKHPKYEYTYLHHLVLPKKKGMHVDHINGRKMDNRSCNLRYLSHKDNLLNSHKSASCGVTIVKNRGNKKYRARVGGNNNVRFEGHFYTEEEARKARNEYLASLGIVV